jgi:hypothetical protein
MMVDECTPLVGGGERQRPSAKLHAAAAAERLQRARARKETLAPRFLVDPMSTNTAGRGLHSSAFRLNLRRLQPLNH